LASAKPYEADGWIGAVAQGGSCNFDQITLVPHCNGTHTECVGHISREKISILKTMREVFLPATVITVTPERGENCIDTYQPHLEPTDHVITRRSLESALAGLHHSFISALVVRTLPNDDSKLTRHYAEFPPPFFSIQAMHFIKELMVRHLLVDFPSLDRMHDQGKLTAHHIFWNVPQGTHDIASDLHSLNSVTEFIYVPEKVRDGLYLLNFQIAPFALDAAPSRPLLFGITEDSI